MGTQGCGSKQGPGFFKPRSPSAMARPWPFQKASGYKGPVLERGAPLARKIHKEKLSIQIMAMRLAQWLAHGPLSFVAVSSIAGVANILFL